MKRILIVDDEQAILDSLELLLEDRYQLALAKDGAEALSALEREPFDLVLLDVLMPILDGVTVLREMRARALDVPVILLSAHANLETTARDLGPVDVLAKPFDIWELELKIDRALEEAERRRRRGTGEAAAVT